MNKYVLCPGRELSHLHVQDLLAGLRSKAPSSLSGFRDLQESSQGHRVTAILSQSLHVV